MEENNMNKQPFDFYKNKGIEYDYILTAKVNIDSNSIIETKIIDILNNEDLMAIYFPELALGRVYAKCKFNNSILEITFGISLIDANSRPTSKDLIKDITDFILALNKNIEQEPKLQIEEGDIKVDIITENKISLNDIDKVLVNESTLHFTRATDTQKLVLTSDGIVEKYLNENLIGTMPFSKLGVLRESKSLIAEGYNWILDTNWKDVITEATIPSQNNTLTNNSDNVNIDSIDDPEQVKKDLQDEIANVDEIQDLKDELEDKLDTLTENDENEQYLLVVYTNVNGDFEPDVCLKGVDGEDFIVADNIEEAKRYSKEEADSLVELFNDPKKNGDQYILKAIKDEDIATIDGLYESKTLNEDTSDTTFPSTEFTAAKRSINDLKYSIHLDKDLSIEQLAWLQANIGNIYVIEDGMLNFAESLGVIDEDEPITSLDDYFNHLYIALKGE
jgi:hypothetical protein